LSPAKALQVLGIRRQILVDAETQAKTSALGAFETLEPLTLKGFAQPVPAFRVISLNSNLERES
jgi:class 3 adenylate cyclase